MSEFTYTTFLGEAKLKLRELAERGHMCPCCGQLAKVYKRKLNSAMARTLIRLNRFGTFVHVPSLSGDNHEVSQLSWWGFVEEERKVREDGGRAGWWRITLGGVSFVNAFVKTRKYAVIYDSTCLRLDGPDVSIRDCLGSKFDYKQLMEGK